MTFLSSLKRNKVLSEWIEQTLTSCHWVPSFPWEHIPIIFFPHSSSYIRSCWLLSDLSSQSQGTVSSTWFSMMRIISTPSEQNVSMQQYQAHVTRFSQHCGLISYKKLQIYVKFFQPNDICPEALELIFSSNFTDVILASALGTWHECYFYSSRGIFHCFPFFWVDFKITFSPVCFVLYSHCFPGKKMLNTKDSYLKLRLQRTLLNGLSKASLSFDNYTLVWAMVTAIVTHFSQVLKWNKVQVY